MNEVTLIQCTNSKRTGTHAARDLYDESDYFVAMREWAKARAVPWFILSAKHGLIHPDAEIADYDERGLDADQATQIATMLVEDGVETVHLTAGTDYTNALVPELEARGIDTINHFAGKQIGERVSKLGKETRQMKNMSVGDYAHDA